MKVYVLQTDIFWRDREANLKKVEDMLEKQQPERGSLVCVPEMFTSGFDIKSDDSVCGADGNLEQIEPTVQAWARKYGISILATGISKNSEKAAQDDSQHKQNVAVFVHPESDAAGITGFTKLHPFSFGKEDYFFESGNKIHHEEIHEFKVAPFICYDLRFPEVFRIAAKQGAEVFIVPANWPFKRAAHWRALLIARAIENQAFVVGINRCGSDPWIDYCGGSIIVAPDGGILAEAGVGEEILEARLERSRLEEYRKQFPALGDMQDRWFTQ